MSILELIQQLLTIRILFDNYTILGIVESDQILHITYLAEIETVILAFDMIFRRIRSHQYS